MQSSDLQKAVALWAEMFAEEDLDVVVLAIKTLIQELEFPPTIADVKKEISKLVAAATNEPTAADEWNAIRKAIGNSIYNSGEMFETLPPIAKQYVGSPYQLKQWAIAEDFNADVAKGQFFKQYEVLKQREKYKTILSEASVIKRLTETKEVKGLEESNG